MKSLDELFAGVKTAAIAGHIRPDGDCVGSCLATYNYITTYYPQIEVSLYLQPIPNIFKFMKNADKIISDCTADKEFDLFIAQDCGDLGRLGDAAKYFEHAKKTGWRITKEEKTRFEKLWNMLLRRIMWICVSE